MSDPILVGEHGPEMVILPSGSMVVPPPFRFGRGFKFGRKPATHPIGLKTIDHYAATLPPAPATFDHTNGFDGFKMLGNGPDPSLTVNGGQPVGDCGVVGSVNVALVDSVETGEKFKMPTSNTVVTDYLRYDHGQDEGVDLSQFLAYWQKVGLPWGKIEASAPVAYNNPEKFWQACNAFGCLYVGIAVPEPMETQATPGGLLDLTGTPADKNILGGHCVVVISRNAEGGELATWGMRVRFTQRWWDAYGEEAHVAITPSQVEKHGNGYGLDLAQLQADLKAL